LRQGESNAKGHNDYLRQSLKSASGVSHFLVPVWDRPSSSIQFATMVLFASTDLKADMIIESIMGIPIMFATPERTAVDALISANAGEEVEVKVREVGLMARTELKEGDKVLYINGVPCPSTAKEAIVLMKEAVDVLKIIAVPTDLPPPPPEVANQFLAEQARLTRGTSARSPVVQQASMNRGGNSSKARRPSQQTEEMLRRKNDRHGSPEICLGCCCALICCDVVTD